MEPSYLQVIFGAAAAHNNYAIPDWPSRVYHGAGFQPAVLALLAAMLAFLFNRHLQKQTTRERLKADTYDKLAEKATEVNEALVDVSAAVVGFDTRLIVLRSIHNSFKMGIPGMTEAKTNAEIREKWNEYVNETAGKVLMVTEKFGKLHRQVELSYFMYLNLEEAFKLLVQDFREYFENGNDYMSGLWMLDPLSLIDERKAEEAKEKLRMKELSESALDRLVHNEDFFYLAQNELLGKLFKFKVKTRTEAKQGKLLTKNGWKNIDPEPSKKDAALE